MVRNQRLAEEHFHKVKLIKRSAYGWMKPDLLRHRALHAAWTRLRER